MLNDIHVHAFIIRQIRYLVGQNIGLGVDNQTRTYLTGMWEAQLFGSEIFILIECNR